MAENTCAHEPCTCRVPEGETYCSDYCRDPDSQPREGGNGCGCGHADCG